MTQKDTKSRPKLLPLYINFFQRLVPFWGDREFLRQYNHWRHRCLGCVRQQGELRFLIPGMLVGKSVFEPFLCYVTVGICQKEMGLFHDPISMSEYQRVSSQNRNQIITFTVKLWCNHEANLVVFLCAKILVPGTIRSKSPLTSTACFGWSSQYCKRVVNEWLNQVVFQTSFWGTAVTSFPARLWTLEGLMKIEVVTG